ncbi:sialate O-acetylesterase [Parasediminibacterium sp. JCM 36343]|uniref:sialate O-acetylesterase n=1 Tax=Parasediminibacterium sp. JCM 36343 TaxID=3374279 RepID=UPI00397E08B7
MKQLLFAAIALFSCSGAFATVKPNSLFTDNMVLQRGVAVPVWGTASDGETVTVEFAGQKQTVVTANGKWMIKLKPLKEGGPFTMTIAGSNTVSVKNILVGDVFLCSGQSNMGFPVRSIRAIGNYPKVSEVIADAANYPLIRQYRVPLKKSEDIPAPIADAGGKWFVCDTTTVKDFSAVAYLFARELQKKIKIPIGIINSSYGGTACQNWISKDSLEANPTLKPILDNYYKALAEFPSKLAKYKENIEKTMAKYSADSATAVVDKKEMPRKPAAPLTPAERGGPSGLYNTMILPLAPYAIKGAVWYQGEANGGQGIQYRTLLPTMINNWRSLWGIGDFPFMIVQIPGWKGHQPELREAQLLTYQKLPNTSMTVINDADDTLDVHPGNKQPVGERLALAAQGLVYKEKIEFMGPIYQSMKVVGNTIEISFTHIGKGLTAKDGDLKDFVIAESDKKFVPAKAVIKGNKVIVSAEGINKPEAVRLGWRLCPQVNLYNEEGLPASPFRTDVAK